MKQSIPFSDHSQHESECAAVLLCDMPIRSTLYAPCLDEFLTPEYQQTTKNKSKTPNTLGDIFNTQHFEVLGLFRNEHVYAS